MTTLPGQGRAPGVSPPERTVAAGSIAPRSPITLAPLRSRADPREWNGRHDLVDTNHPGSQRSTGTVSQPGDVERCGTTSSGGALVVRCGATCSGGALVLRSGANCSDGALVVVAWAKIFWAGCSIAVYLPPGYAIDGTRLEPYITEDIHGTLPAHNYDA